MSDYKVSIPSPEETKEVLARLKRADPAKRNKGTMLLDCGLEIKGSYGVVAKDAESGEVVWEHSANNLITDFGRRIWVENQWTAFCLGFSPSTETPRADRGSLAGDISQLFTTTNLTPSNNPVTHTKQVSTTFTTPPNNRTLGTIWLQSYNDGIHAQGYVHGIIAYALLTPPKIWTTTQTLEVVYKISMSPIY